MKKTYKFKPGSKIVHNETKEIKKVININVRTDMYSFAQEGTRTLKKISQKEIEDNYEIFRLENIWDKL